ncbi:DUF3597 domain-containing protein [Rhodoplanes sp. SY1]|uniref:DUF3597 domain-containing protein n=1 Tax=Rhodoplanes sp. SY1 TaxID=3166646 RepID=UPI0038B5CBE0
MSVLGTIMSRIFGHARAEDGPAPASTSSPPPSAAPGSASPAPSDRSTPLPSAPPASTPPSGRPSGGDVDVAAVLTEKAAKRTENLDWRRSIVDLMKLLDLDSSLAARKELARELHYSGDTNDSATMNVWLHGQVMKKLAENGGRVPDDLRA